MLERFDRYQKYGDCLDPSTIHSTCLNMNLDTITKGEELLKEATKGPFRVDTQNGDSIETLDYEWVINTDTEFYPKNTENDIPFVCFLLNHASELLQCAREVEGTREHCQQLMDEIDSLQHEVKRLEEILDKPY